jgi:hypothetical protein
MNEASARCSPWVSAAVAIDAIAAELLAPAHASFTCMGMYNSWP